MDTFLLERNYACKRYVFACGMGVIHLYPKELCHPSNRPDGIELKETQDVQNLCKSLSRGKTFFRLSSITFMNISSVNRRLSLAHDLLFLSSPRVVLITIQRYSL